MATFTELEGVASANTLLAKITAACAIQAQVIYTEASNPNHVNRLIWAKQASADPASKAKEMTWSLLAQNAGAAIGAITGASDATILAAVAAAVDLFATGA